jgi:hypothetical protein
MRALVLSSLVAILLTLFMVSCKKETPDTDTQAAIDHAICEGEFVTIINNVISYGNNTNGIRANTPILTIDSSNSSFHKLTIDYGTSGMLDSIDGKYRKGKIVAKYYNHFLAATAKASVQLIDFASSNNNGGLYVNYYVDSIQIVRTSTTNYTAAVVFGKAVSGTVSLNWENNYTFSQLDGNTTFTDFSDDVFSINGIAKGKDRKGNTYVSTTTSNLIKRANCKWVESGTSDISPNGGNIRTLEYGGGSCDNKVSVVINGNTFSFTLN